MDIVYSDFVKLSLLLSLIFVAIFIIYLIFWIVLNFKARKLGKGKGPSLFSPLLLLFVLLALEIAKGWNTPVKESERYKAQRELNAIYGSQNIYHENTGKYAGGEDAFKLLGWEPEKDYNHAYYCGNDVIAMNEKIIPKAPPKKWGFKTKPITTDNSFICMAVGNLDSDTGLDGWYIDEKANLVSLKNDIYDAKWKSMARTSFIMFSAFLILFLASIFEDRRRYKKALISKEQDDADEKE